MKDEQRFISFEELKEIRHVEYLSQTPRNDVSKVCRTTKKNEFYTLKSFKTANFKEFQKFMREFEIISSIKHPSIVKFYRFTNSTNEIPYPLLIVEFLPYNLRELITKYKTDAAFSENPLTNTHKVEIIIDLLFGLKFLHEENQIMHRNLKPENILITKKYHAKIGDFAWANSIEDDLNYSKKETGPMPYMAPELLNGDDYGEKIDQFSFGRILYFILSDGKEPPFNMNDIENGITFKRIPELNDLSAEIIEKYCEYEPENRPTFSEVIDIIVKGKFLLLPGVDADEIGNIGTNRKSINNYLVFFFF